MDGKEKIKFLNRRGDDFLTAVRERVDSYFRHAGMSRAATPQHKAKVILLAAAWMSTYLAILNERFPLPVLLLLAMLLGVLTGITGINISHDAAHGSFSLSRRMNKAFSYTYDLIGMSSYIWKVTHNGGHHIFTNIAGHDPDIDKPYLLRLSPHSPHLWFHRLQNIYIWLLYSFVSLNWIYISDYIYMAKEIKKISALELFLFFFFKGVHIAIFVVFPLLYMSLPWWQVLVGYAALQMTGGFTVALIFQLAHLVENVQFPEPDKDGLIHNQWGVHEMLTTANFGTRNPLLFIILGGLNFQIEHHLFPHIAHSHYREISHLVRETAAEFGLPYHEYPTMSSAVSSHWRLLKKLGRPQ